jgi:type IV secretion system protein TrbE
MLNLNEFRNRAYSFADLLNWAALVDEGVVLGKDGSLMTAVRYAGPDLDSSTENDLEALMARANSALSRLDEGWSVHVDVLRRYSSEYPDSPFPDAATRIIDEERKAAYRRQGSHFENDYVMALCFQPSDRTNFLFGMVSDEKGKVEGNSFEAQISRFKDQVADITRPLSGSGWTEMRPMDSEEMLSYLYFCITGQLRPLKLPAIPMYLDALLSPHDFVGGNEPRIGQRHIRVVSVVGLPTESHPGMLDVLSGIPVSYRWNTRFIALSQHQGIAEIKRLQKTWFGQRLSIGDHVRANANAGMTFEDGDAVSMTADASAALQEASNGIVKFGYYTCTVVLSDEDKNKVEAAAVEVVKRLESRVGFAATVEAMNAVEAYLGSLPGHRVQNVRRPIVHTYNLADLLPLTAVFPGRSTNPCPFYPKASPALIYADTAGNTPFRLNIHVGDVGHTTVLGPTGAGKSTLLGLIVAQFFRYPEAQVFLFDKGYSAFVLCQAAGGNHYDILGEGGALSFYPLQGIDEPNELAWATEWVETLFVMQGATVDVAKRKAIHEALVLLSHDTVDRSIGALQSKFSTQEMRDYLQPYCFDGQMGTLLDSRSDALREGRFQVFELEHLMSLGGERADKWVVPVLLYLFRQIEKRLDGRPSLIVLDEAWLMLDHPIFQAKIREWLKVLRKANCAVIFATQSISDVMNSRIKDVILESCPTKIFLPNREATNDYSRKMYEALGMNEKELEVIAHSTPKYHYFYKSTVGKRLISLGLGPVALSFIGASGKQDIARCRQLQVEHGEGWVSEWLKERELADWGEYYEKVRLKAAA